MPIMPQPSHSSEIYYSDEPDSANLLLVVAVEKISKLEVQLAQVSQMEKKLHLDITNLQIELATMFSMLHTEEAKLGESWENSVSSAPLKHNAPSSVLSIPPSTPQKTHTMPHSAFSHTKALLFQKIDPIFFLFFFSSAFS